MGRTIFLFVSPVSFGVLRGQNQLLPQATAKHPATTKNEVAAITSTMLCQDSKNRFKKKTDKPLPVAIYTPFLASFFGMSTAPSQP